jgi:hypothetical protein
MMPFPRSNRLPYFAFQKQSSIGALFVLAFMALGATVIGPHAETAEASAFRLYTMSPLVRAYDDLPAPTGPETTEVRLSLAGDEYESFQLLVVAGHKDLTGVRLHFDKLRAKSGAVIPAAELTARPVGYVKLKKGPQNRPGYKGRWIPDVLLERDRFPVKAGALQPVWVTLHAPAGTPAGEYIGKLIVKADDVPGRSLLLRAHVWGFTIPRPGTLRAITSTGSLEGWTREERLDFYDFLAQYRFNATSIYSDEMLPRREDLDACVKLGLNAVNVRRIKPGVLRADGGKWRERIAEQIKADVEFLRKKGLLPYAFVYLCDEPDKKDFPDIIDAATLVKETAPGLKRFGCVSILKDLEGFIDIWDPTVAKNSSNCEFPEHADVGALVAERHKKGEEVFWNVCVCPSAPYPNINLDFPAADARALGWMTWKYGIDGFEYWRFTFASKRHTYASLVAGFPHTQWNSHTWRNINCDGLLAYPAPTRGKLLASARLENLRDGFEDYEIHALLERLVAKLPARHAELAVQAKQALAVPEKIVKDRKTFTRDPALYEAARERICTLLEKVGAVVGNRVPRPVSLDQ